MAEEKTTTTRRRGRRKKSDLTVLASPNSEISSSETSTSSSTTSEKVDPRPVLPVKVMKVDPRAEIPSYAYQGDSGFDLTSIEYVVIRQGEVKPVRTGLAFELPVGFEIQIRGRSGLAKDHGVIIAQGVGTIDSGYRGEVIVLLAKLTPGAFIVNPGDKIAQGVISGVIEAHFEEVKKLSKSKRGANGFGSSG